MPKERRKSALIGNTSWSEIEPRMDIVHPLLP